MTSFNVGIHLNKLLGCNDKIGRANLEVQVDGSHGFGGAGKTGLRYAQTNR